MEEDEENVPASPHVQDDNGMDDEEGKHNEKDNQTYHTPTKQALLQKRKEKFHPFDSSVPKLNDKFLTLLHCVVLMFLLLLLLLGASDVVSVRFSSADKLLLSEMSTLSSNCASCSMFNCTCTSSWGK